MGLSWKISRHSEQAEFPGQSGGGRTVLIASAALIDMASVDHFGAPRIPATREWQEIAWALYDEVCELRAGIGWLSNACGQATLYAAHVEPRGSAGSPKPITEGKLTQPLEELYGGASNQGGMLSRFATLLSVPGEAYLVGVQRPDPRRAAKMGKNTSTVWAVCSSDEFERSDGGDIRVRNPADGDDYITVNSSSSTVIRVWRPHGRKQWEADSPVRPLIRPLRELVGLSAHIQATVDSRLAGAGILVVPESACAVSPAESEGTPNPLHEDPFMAALIEASVVPLKNPASAGAVVPMMVKVPDASVNGFKHLRFSTELDQNINPLRESAIRRIATGMDMPAEVLLGTADVTHWGVWALDEASLKMHVQPLLGVICQALTVNYYRPALIQLGYSPDEAAEYAIYADTTELALRPNRSPEAIRLYEVGAIGAATLRRESGFDEEDAPTEEEAIRILATRMAMANSNLAPLLMSLIGINIPEGALQATTGGNLQSANANTNNPLVKSERNQPVDATTAERKPQGGPSAETPPNVVGPQPVGPQDLPARTASAALSTEVATRRGDSYRLALGETAVLAALEKAGRWLTRQAGKEARDLLADNAVKLQAVHCHIPTQERAIPGILAGAFVHLQRSTPSDRHLHRTCALYVHELIASGTAYSRDQLAALLASPEHKSAGGENAA